ncbi:hypothetical protein SeMB42_g06946 [Synchytrium endobioticum]|uniref:Uncharacterized protein n=1 Tax=Synchytrium endobioticum TaxID=286115 RepID=A0A507C6V1_9FUNG|nr:hypothetical protein SeMB42_g06946 [Synchytrium endobioticum]
MPVAPLVLVLMAVHHSLNSTKHLQISSLLDQPPPTHSGGLQPSPEFVKPSGHQAVSRSHNNSVNQSAGSPNNAMGSSATAAVQQPEFKPSQLVLDLRCASSNYSWPESVMPKAECDQGSDGSHIARTGRVMREVGCQTGPFQIDGLREVEWNFPTRALLQKDWREYDVEDEDSELTCYDPHEDVSAVLRAVAPDPDVMAFHTLDGSFNTLDLAEEDDKCNVNGTASYRPPSPKSNQSDLFRLVPLPNTPRPKPARRRSPPMLPATPASDRTVASSAATDNEDTLSISSSTVFSALSSGTVIMMNDKSRHHSKMSYLSKHSAFSVFDANALAPRVKNSANVVRARGFASTDVTLQGR